MVERGTHSFPSPEPSLEALADTGAFIHLIHRTYLKTDGKECMKRGRADGDQGCGHQEGRKCGHWCNTGAAESWIRDLLGLSQAVHVAGRIQACAGEDGKGVHLIWRSWFSLSLMRLTLERTQPHGKGSLNHVKDINWKGTTDNIPRGWESKWPGHPKPSLLLSLLKRDVGI